MRILGIDYGSKRVGLAISDEGAQLAFPHSVVANDKNLTDTIIALVEKEQAGKIVIGESKDFSGKPNAIQKETENFVAQLKTQIQTPIIFEPEFLSSFQAENIQHRRPDPRNSEPRAKIQEHKDLDASAAAIILQSYLDRKMA